MEKEFIPYEEALALKELGFDEDCLAVHSINLMTENEDWELRIGGIWKNQELVDSIKAPTFSQAFRWFREKYGLEGLILPQSQGAVIDREPIYFIAIISYENELMKELFNSTNQEDLLHYNPREEAELECLKKLIEIVKTK